MALNNYMDNGDENYSNEEIKKLLIDSLKVKLQDDRKKPSKVILNQAITASLSEFLTCFKLIGYDIDGNPVRLTMSKTKLDKSALDNAFIEEFGDFMNRKIMDG